MSDDELFGGFILKGQSGVKDDWLVARHDQRRGFRGRSGPVCVRQRNLTVFSDGAQKPPVLQSRPEKC